MQGSLGKGDKTWPLPPAHKKNLFFASVCGEKTPGIDSEPVLANGIQFSFSENVIVKHLHIRASLQNFSLVTQSVYINPKTREMLPFAPLCG